MWTWLLLLCWGVPWAQGLDALGPNLRTELHTVTETVALVRAGHVPDIRTEAWAGATVTGSFWKQYLRPDTLGCRWCWFNQIHGEVGPVVWERFVALYSFVRFANTVQQTYYYGYNGPWTGGYMSTSLAIHTQGAGALLTPTTTLGTSRVSLAEPPGDIPIIAWDVDIPGFIAGFNVITGVSAVPRSVGHWRLGYPFHTSPSSTGSHEQHIPFVVSDIPAILQQQNVDVLGNSTLRVIQNPAWPLWSPGRHVNWHPRLGNASRDGYPRATAIPFADMQQRGVATSNTYTYPWQNTYQTNHGGGLAPYFPESSVWRSRTWQFLRSPRGVVNPQPDAQEIDHVRTTMPAGPYNPPYALSNQDVLWCLAYPYSRVKIGSWVPGRAVMTLNPYHPNLFPTTDGDFACPGYDNAAQFMTGGMYCNQSVPFGFDPTNATECPDPAVYDLCSGRGACIPNPLGGVGVTCVCRDGWFGGDFQSMHRWPYLAGGPLYPAPLYRPIVSPTQFMTIYASKYLCGTGPTYNTPQMPTLSSWDYWYTTYPVMNQCTLWQGTSQPWNWYYEQDSVQAHNPFGGNSQQANAADPDYSFIPQFPYRCNDLRRVSNNANTYPPEEAQRLYGGFHCSPCPDCDTQGTLRCDDVNRTAAIYDNVRHVHCICKTGYVGPTCNLSTCPWDPNEQGQQGTLPCGEHAGRGVCRLHDDHGSAAPRWNASYAGSCLCHAGWGGADGTCSVELCPHDTNGTACGPHGHCVPTDVVNHEVWIQASTGEIVVDPDLCTAPMTTAQRTHCLAVRPTLHLLGDATQGHCVCDPAFNVCPASTPGCPTGMCLQRACPRVKGVECNGLTNVATGANVCHRAHDPPQCQCWKSWPAAMNTVANTLEVMNTYHNGPQGACEVPNNASCMAGGDQHAHSSWCSGTGGAVCLPPHCLTVDNAAAVPGCDLNTAPVCRCSPASASRGTYCQWSLCGSYTPQKACSAHSLGTVTTGLCQRGHCQCFPVEGVWYIGDNCETPVPGCTNPADTSLCNGDNGDCRLDGASGLYACHCKLGYSGTYCQTHDHCNGLCPGWRGQCVPRAQAFGGGFECQCHNNFYGPNCEHNGCVLSGGVNITHDLCDCTAVDGIQYPVPGDNNASAFRGCRKRCPHSTTVSEGLECGGPYQRTDTSAPLNRCYPPVGANSTDTATCLCSEPAYNPLVPQSPPQVVLWTDDGNGACEPLCVHCPEASGGGCDTSVCPHEQDAEGHCQYYGSRCNQRRCTGVQGAFWDGSACVCHPQWLYTWPNGTAISANCSATRCEQLNGGVAPTADNTSASDCICAYPTRVDTDPQSPTHRMCIDDCGDHGTADLAARTCVCRGVFTGTHCDVDLCAADQGIPSPRGDFCVCHRPQWGGPYCNVSQCVGGTPLGARETGCTCGPVWSGTLCDTDLCVHGTASDTGLSSYCACEPGWSGDRCTFDACVMGTIVPVPCGGSGQEACLQAHLNYNCHCGDPSVAVFSAATHGCVGVPHPTHPCGEHGVVSKHHHNNTLKCACGPGWYGPLCQFHVCGAAAFTEDRHVAQLDPTADVHYLNVSATDRSWIDHGYLCACNPPFYNVSSNCTYLNCTALGYPYEVDAPVASWAGARVVNVAPSTCGCNLPGYKMEWYDPDRHTLGVANETAEYDKWVHAHPNATYQHGMAIVCVWPCHPMGTSETLANAQCVCNPGWEGTFCDTPTPPPTPAPEGREATVVPESAWAAAGVAVVIMLGLVYWCCHRGHNSPEAYRPALPEPVTAPAVAPGATGGQVSPFAPPQWAQDTARRRKRRRPGAARAVR